MNEQLGKIYKRVLDEGVPIRFLAREGDQNLITKTTELLRQELDLVEIVEAFPIEDFFGPITISDILMTYVKIYIGQGVSYDELLEVFNDYFRVLSRNEYDDEEEKKEVKSFENSTDLQSTFISWSQDLQKEYSKDEEFALQMTVIEKDIFGIKPVKHSSFQISKVDLIMKPKDKIDDEEAIEVFNNIKISERFCFASLYVRNNLYTKVFTGTEKIKTVPYDAFVPQLSRMKIPNQFMFVLWVGDGSFYRGAQIEYIHVFYDIDSNVLRIEQISQEYSKLAVEVVKRSTGIRFNEEIQEVKISGLFFFNESFNIDPIPFLHLILNDWRFFFFMFVNETDRPAADKKGLRIRYRGIGSDISGEDSSLAALTASLQNEILDGKEKSVVKVSGAYSLLHINEFTEVISRLVRIYLDSYEKISKDYYDLVPMQQMKGKMRIVSAKEQKEGTVQELKKAIPDAFVENYTTQCPSRQQPLIISPEKRALFEQETFVIGKVTYHRQVMGYPPLEPKIYVGCGRNEYPFPGLRKNTLTNKDKYPFFPCCFKSNHMDDPNSEYRRLIDQREKEGRGGHHVKTMRTLEYSQTGNIPLSLGNFLAKYKEGAKAQDFIRIGVVRSPNSIVHSILQASDNEEYRKAKTTSAREAVARKYRALLANNRYFSPQLLKQEMFDFKDEEISKILSDPEIPLDISLFYHILEVALTSNIFVFQMSKKDTSILAEVSVPRCKFYSIRNIPPDSPSVILLKQEDDPYHVEIIGHYDSKSKVKRTVFGSRMTYTLNTAYMSSTSLHSWIYEDDSILGRKYLSNLIDYNFLNTEKTKRIAQFIDGYGKSRGFVMETDLGKVSIFTPPTQPVNLDNIEPRLAPECKIEDAIKIFGTPIGRSEMNGKTNGIWYPFMGMMCGLYVPVSINSDTSLKILLPDPLRTSGVGIAERIAKLRRTGSVILQIVFFLYLLSGRDKSKIEDLIQIANINENTYNIKSLPNHLPQFKSFDDAVKWFEKRIPTVFKDGHMMAYSERFKKNLIGKVDEYENATKGLKLTPERHLKGLFDFETDFRIDEDTAMFLREEDFNYWYVQQKKMNLTVPIYESLAPILLDSTNEPILYLGEEGIFLIQKILRLAPDFMDDRERVSEINLRRALTVGLVWERNLINIGRDIPDSILLDEGVLPAYKIYQLSIEGYPTVVEDWSGGSDLFIKILRVGELDKYFTMLPIQ